MKTMFVSILAAALFPVATFAFINATSVSFTPNPVAPGAQVDAEVHVQLTNGDDWKWTRIEVSIPGPNNDIDICDNTADATSNGTHVRHVLFNAPNTDGNYTVTATAYENFLCTGSHNDATGTLHVVTPPPPPADVCPNLEGAQAVVPEGYELVDGQCVEIVVEEPVDVCPNIEGVQETVPEGMELNDGQCVEVSSGGGEEPPVEEEKPKQSTSGGGGFTYCDLHTEPTSSYRDIAMCIDRDTGRVVQILAYRASHGDAQGGAQLEIALWMKVVDLLKQMVALL